MVAEMSERNWLRGHWSEPFIFVGAPLVAFSLMLLSFGLFVNSDGCRRSNCVKHCENIGAKGWAISDDASVCRCIESEAKP